METRNFEEQYGLLIDFILKGDIESARKIIESNNSIREYLIRNGFLEAEQINYKAIEENYMDGLRQTYSEAEKGLASKVKI